MDNNNINGVTQGSKPFPLPDQLWESEIQDSVVQEIEEAFVSRRIRYAGNILNEWLDVMPTLRLPQKNAAAMVDYFAWAMYLDPGFVPVVETLICRFKENIPRGSMPLLDLVHLNIAEGIVKLRLEQYSEAISHFEQAIYYADGSQHHNLMIVARYYLARGYLKSASYDKALTCVQSSREFAQQAGPIERVAMIESLEGLIRLLRGNTEKAERLFERAEAGLKGREEDHLIEYGNLCLFRFRIARRRGDYIEAEKKLRQGITYYERHDPHHRNIARACTHLAVVYRLKAKQLESEKRSPEIVKKIGQNQNEALEFLKKAEEIYNMDPRRSQQGLSKVHITRASVLRDMWSLRDARQEVDEAFRLGQQKNDNLVMARARIVQCKIALQDGQYNLRTLELVEEAVRYSKATEYPRLQARALICQGMARLRVLDDVLGAEKCRSDADSLLSGYNDRDYMRDELNELKEEIAGFYSPDTPVVTRSMSDLVKFMPSKAVIPGARAKNGDPEAKCDFEQIIDEIEEEILRHLLGLVGGRVARVAATWHVGAAKVLRAARTFMITEESLQKLVVMLSGNTLQIPDEKKNQILRGLAELKGEKVLGQASFISRLKQSIGHEETNLFKAAILENVETSKFESGSDDESN